MHDLALLEHAGRIGAVESEAGFAGRPRKRLPRSNPSAQSFAQCVHHDHGGRRAHRGTPCGVRNAARNLARAPARDSGCTQGLDRYRWGEDHCRLGRVRASGAAGGRRRRRTIEERGCGAAGQAQHAGVRLWRNLGAEPLWSGVESLEPQVHRRRLFRRFGSRGRRRSLLRVARLGYGRLDPRACRILRRRRSETYLRGGQQSRRHSPVLVARHPRTAHANGRRFGSRAASHRRLRSGRSLQPGPTAR